MTWAAAILTTAAWGCSDDGAPPAANADAGVQGDAEGDAPEVAVEPPCVAVDTTSGFVRTRNPLDDALVYWPQEALAGCLPLATTTAGSEELTEAEARGAIVRAAERWTEAASECAPGLCLRDIGERALGEGLGYRRDGANVNLIALIQDPDDWPRAYSRATVALMVPTIDARTSVMLDADIVVNDAAHRLTDTLPSPDDAYDLDSVVTHELGHALGFEHTELFESVMFGSTSTDAPDRRTLQPLDHAGLCEAYRCYPATQPAP